jgi:hypothetical protein
MWSLSRRRLEERAHKQRESAEESLVEHEVVVAVGPRPAWDPVNNPEHGLILRDLDRSEIEELEADLRGAEDEASRHTAPWILFCSLVGLFIVEWIGTTMVVRALDFENPERSILGGMLAIFAFFITYCSVRFALPTVASGEAAPRRSPWFYVVPVGYALFVLAVTALRVHEASATAEGSLTADIASGLVMLFVTIGPAAVAEMVMRRWVPAARAAKRRRTLRRRLARRQRALRRAENYRRNLGRRQEEWDRKAAQLRALYGRAYQSARVVDKRRELR